MGVDVRAIWPEDWRDWRNLRLRALADSPEAFGSTLAQEQSFTEHDWRDRCANAVLAYDGGVPVAMGAGFSDEPGWLMVVAMWTDPVRRGEGIGGQVLEAVVQRARELGLRPHLHAMRANPDAARLYERHGFVRTGRFERHGGRDADELALPS